MKNDVCRSAITIICIMGWTKCDVMCVCVSAGGNAIFNLNKVSNVNEIAFIDTRYKTAGWKMYSHCIIHYAGKL